MRQQPAQQSRTARLVRLAALVVPVRGARAVVTGVLAVRPRVAATALIVVLPVVGRDSLVPVVLVIAGGSPRYRAFWP